MSIFFVSARLRPEVEVNAQVEGSLAAEVNSIVLDTLEHLVQVLYFVFFIFWRSGDIEGFLIVGLPLETLDSTQ